MKIFCVVVAKVKNDLERNKVIAWSVPGFSGCSEHIKCTETRSSQPSKRGYFLPQTEPGIFGSAADRVSLGEMFLCQMS